MQDQNCLIWVFLGWNLKKLLYCDILHHYPQIFPNTKFRLKIKILKFATTIALNGYFGLDFKKLMPYLKSTFPNLLTCKVSSKNKKTLNLGLKFLFQHQTFNQHPRICETKKFHPKRKKQIWDQKCSISVFGLDC